MVLPALTDWILYLKPIRRSWLAHRPDDGGSKHLRNVSELLPDYAGQQPRRPPSSSSPSWVLEISHCVTCRFDPEYFFTFITRLHSTYLFSMLAHTFFSLCLLKLVTRRIIWNACKSFY
jgi:hypothetical protein